ncbi:nucleotide exchange factor GrpE [Natronobiforma cellulositropha]|uniref:nucleotide exchange factor GrpE n=1 Tax=Natronobiforma cellulositropha TaxID=1679076 RepID=UPI0021D5B000|nr:nucleotide exchange factor GrpE [Natronobiforma cellulositropha]
MSDDEGMNSARDVPSTDDTPDDAEDERPEVEHTDDGTATAEDEHEADDSGVEESIGETDADADADGAPSVRPPETSEDIRELIDRTTAYDDDLALEVKSVVETARELHTTVNQQQAELADLEERLEEQAKTIESLQEELEAREAEIEARGEKLEERAEELSDREDELESREETIEELKAHVKRKQADFQNYKRRTKKRQEQLKARATEDLVGRIVGVRDNLKRALGEEHGDLESLRDGIEMTLREFDRVLADENVEEIDPEPGTEVDPQRHEVMVQVDSGQPAGTIADVFTPGYEMGEKVIQNAQVTVSNGSLEEGEDSDADPDTDTDTDADADSDGDVDTDGERDGGDGEEKATGEEPESETGDTPASEDEAADGQSEGDVDEAGDESANGAEGAAIELGGEVADDADDEETESITTDDEGR